MSKVLRMIDFDELITWEHEQFLIEEGMKESVKPEDEPGFVFTYNYEDENENITDDDKLESYVNPDGLPDFSPDDIPF